MRTLAILIALAGCSDGSVRLPSDAAVDAAPDSRELDGCGHPRAKRPRIAPEDVSLVPFTTTGTTPDGSLDDIRYLGISYTAGFCPSGYRFDLYRSEDLGDLVASIQILYPFKDRAPGALAAQAWLVSNYDRTCSDDARFQVTRIDDPVEPQLQIAGRVLLNDGVWNLDFSVDGPAPRISCL